MAVPCVGEFWGVQYFAGDEFHARLVVSVVEGKEVIVTTPDLDVYEEDFGSQFLKQTAEFYKI